MSSDPPKSRSNESDSDSDSDAEYVELPGIQRQGHVETTSTEVKTDGSSGVSSSSLFGHSFSDQPALFDLALHVSAIDNVSDDLPGEDNPEYVSFFTGNPAIQKFRGQVSIE